MYVSARGPCREVVWELGKRLADTKQENGPRLHRRLWHGVAGKRRLAQAPRRAPEPALERANRDQCEQRAPPSECRFVRGRSLRQRSPGAASVALPCCFARWGGAWVFVRSLALI